MSAGVLVALAFPDRIAAPRQSRYCLSGGGVAGT
jgi:hypothetical protein